MPLADTLLRLAAGAHLYLPKWSDQIMAKVSQTFQEKFNLSAQKAMQRKMKYGGIFRNHGLKVTRICPPR
jgi:hypothetical protein